MFSRHGKSTISQYLAFDRVGKNNDEGLEVIDSDVDNEASALTLYDDKKTDIAREIKKITDLKKTLALQKKQKKRQYGAHGNDEESKAPIEFLQEAEFRRTV